MNTRTFFEAGAQTERGGKPGPGRTRDPSPHRRGSKGHRAPGGTPARPTPAPAGGLSATAARLLSALAVADAYAVADPTQDGRVLVRTLQGGVSLSAGAYPERFADELVRADLATHSVTPSGRAAFRLSDAGRAHERRRRAEAGGSAFLAQHRDTRTAERDVEGERARVEINAAESPLDWLARRKDRQGEPLVDAAGHQAGERLRRDLTLAGLVPAVTARWDGLRAGRHAAGPADAADTALAARQRVTLACEAVGAEFADLLIDLCGFLKGLETLERERGWPARSAKVVVKLALSRLADHYGLARTAQGPARSRGVRSWRAAPEADRVV